ncbi:MAG: BlaI/MecI/CopY family transcriptional regulator [Actinomycetales bacterium]|nr:BlaI/MecI/CopY family transcriptional regulator [Actinomycetales bacterium]
MARTPSTLGDLESAVMQIVWDSADPLSAYQILDLMPERELAPTTVLTVLGRLERKGLVRTDRAARPHRYRAVASRAEHRAELMHQVLGDGADRQAVLERFVGGVTADDRAALRRLLGNG